MDDAYKLIELLPDSKMENQLFNLLKDKPEEERYFIIDSILRSSLAPIRLSGLRLTKRLVLNKDHLQKVLDLGLKRCDVSEIEHWLEAVAPKLGSKKLLAIMEKYLSSAPHLVILAMYKLSILIHSKYPDRINQIEELKKKIDSMIADVDIEYLNYWQAIKKQ